MPDPVVIDTHVFNRSLLEDQLYRAVYEKLVARCDRLLVNRQILDEYARMAQRAGVPATLIAAEVLPELRRLGKLQITGNRSVRVGPRQDRRFIAAAIQGRARYLISNDADFRGRAVSEALQGAHITVLSPIEYANLA